MAYSDESVAALLQMLKVESWKAHLPIPKETAVERSDRSTPWRTSVLLRLFVRGMMLLFAVSSTGIRALFFPLIRQERLFDIARDSRHVSNDHAGDADEEAGELFVSDADGSEDDNGAPARREDDAHEQEPDDELIEGLNGKCRRERRQPVGVEDLLQYCKPRPSAVMSKLRLCLLTSQKLRDQVEGHGGDKRSTEARPHVRRFFSFRKRLPLRQLNGRCVDRVADQQHEVDEHV